MKLNAAVFFGGRSREHEVSRNSAINIMSYLNPSKYNILPVYISKEGKWFLYDGSLTNIPDEIESFSALVTFSSKECSLLRIVGDKVRSVSVDIAVPALHGKYGEDGTIQGLFEMMNLPYVGCGPLASALAMDKTYTRLIAAASDIPITPYLVFTKNSDPEDSSKKIRSELGYPCFIKPASSGSSVGTNKAKNKKEIIAALKEAFEIDNKVIVEKFIKGTEIECALLGEGENTLVSIPGEISTPDDFYTYEAKYGNPLSKNIIPATVSEKTMEKAMYYSQKIFKAIGGSGLARADFFVQEKTGKVFFNEINTMPGFTNISMYPQLAFYMGLKPYELMDRLIELGLRRASR